MTPELVAHMRLSHYKGLWRTLYDSDHGFGERKVKLNLTSGQRGFTIEIPLTCHYEDNRPVLSTRNVSKSEWATLCKLVSDESVLKVIIFDEAHDFLARITPVGAKPPKVDMYQVKLRWQEDDEFALVLRKSIKWITEILE